MQWEGQWKVWAEKILVLGVRVSLIYRKRTIGGTDLGKLTRRGITWKVADSTMRKGKCLLAKDCEHYSSIVTAVECFELVKKTGQM